MRGAGPRCTAATVTGTTGVGCGAGFEHAVTAARAARMPKTVTRMRISFIAAGLTVFRAGGEAIEQRERHADRHTVAAPRQWAEIRVGITPRSREVDRWEQRAARGLHTGAGGADVGEGRLQVGARLQPIGDERVDVLRYV